MLPWKSLIARILEIDLLGVGCTVAVRPLPLESPAGQVGDCGDERPRDGNSCNAERTPRKFRVMRSPSVRIAVTTALYRMRITRRNER